MRARERVRTRRDMVVGLEDMDVSILTIRDRAYRNPDEVLDRLETVIAVQQVLAAMNWPPLLLLQALAAEGAPPVPVPPAQCERFRELYLDQGSRGMGGFVRLAHPTPNQRR
jgi:hypothetical protein